MIIIVYYEPSQGPDIPGIWHAIVDQPGIHTLGGSRYRAVYDAMQQLFDAGYRGKIDCRDVDWLVCQ